MKHAILILAHKDINQVKHLIEYFERDCYVYIHIDKTGEISRANASSLLSLPQTTKVFRKYSLHWGGFSILKTEVFLLKEALENCDAEYFHLISGQDYPIKPLSYFLDFFKAYKNLNFLSFVHIPHPKWQENTYDRLTYYYFFDFFKERVKSCRLSKKWVNTESKYRIKRKIPQYFNHLYGGSQWFSITRAATTELLRYTKKHKSFYRRLHFTFAPEEIYIQTVLVNLLPKHSIINNNKRFIRWKKENGNYPANLAMEHFHLLAESDDLFARKMDYPISSPLVSSIDKYLIKENSTFYQLYNNGNTKNKFEVNLYNPRITECLYTYIKGVNLQDVLDIGCGCGFYVAALRRLRISIMGYDYNPLTTEISSLLLPWGDTLCGVADFTKKQNGFVSFDLVICLNVFQYIKVDDTNALTENLLRFSKKSIIISWDSSFERNLGKNILSKIKTKGFKQNFFAESYFRNHIRNISVYHIFEKQV